MIDRDHFNRGLALLKATYPTIGLDDAVAEAWYALLSPAMDDATYEAAVMLTLAIERFPPAPAVVLEKAKQITKSAGQTRNGRDREEGRGYFDTLKAKGQTHESATYHVYRHAELQGDAAMQALAAIGGPEALEWEASRERFAAAYATAKQMARETIRRAFGQERGVDKALLEDTTLARVTKALVNNMDAKRKLAPERGAARKQIQAPRTEREGE